MKSTLPMLLAGASATGCLALSGCGGGGTSSSYPTTPLAPATDQLNTASVLAIVQTQTSETSLPFAVDGGRIEVVPTDDETGAPISVIGS
jgi:hypothetical protein